MFEDDLAKFVDIERQLTQTTPDSAAQDATPAPCNDGEDGSSSAPETA